MKTFPAADLTRHTGDLFTAATLAPVAITGVVTLTTGICRKQH